MTPREAFLQRVRQAVADGNRPGAAPPLPARGAVGYQGAGPDPVVRFCAELAAAGGQAHLAADRETALQTIADVLQAHAAQKILVGCGGLLDRLGVADRLTAAGLTVHVVDALPSPSPRDTLFAAEVGVSNVYRLVAETGTVVMATGPQDPRSLSLLPPVHIAVADPTQILPDLFDLFDLFSPVAEPGAAPTPPPSCLSLITGPSKTGDIELKLVTGVHGPGELHVIVCTF